MKQIGYILGVCLMVVGAAQATLISTAQGSGTASTDVFPVGFTASSAIDLANIGQSTYSVISYGSGITAAHAATINNGVVGASAGVNAEYAGSRRARYLGDAQTVPPLNL
jgi:hypothetical protein